MKIEKSTSGGVIIKNEDGSIRNIIKSENAYLHLHPRNPSAIMINNQATDQDDQNSIVINAATVTEIDGAAFAGNRDDLLVALDPLFNLGGDVGEGAQSAATSGYPQPYVSTISVEKINTEKTVAVEIFGSFFTPTTTVEVAGQTIADLVFVDSHKITFNLTTGSVAGVFDMIINNGVKETVLENRIEVNEFLWIDLRSRGETLTHGNLAGRDIRYRSGMSMGRDAGGVYFVGAAPWSSWVKFESLKWTRGENKTMEFIFKGPSAAMMIGIGSTATDEGSSAQYSQGETHAYFSSSSQLYGFYGNNGTVGVTASFSGSYSSISSSHFYKLKIEGDGGAGARFTLYRLPNSAVESWDNEQTVLRTGTITSLNPDEKTIMPFIIPNNGGTQRFIAIKIK